MAPATHARRLEDAVRRARTALDDAPADCLVWSATGLPALADRLDAAERTDLAALDGAPACTRGCELVRGRWGSGDAALDTWILDGHAVDPEHVGAPWEAAFPAWLAAASGARVLVHTSAGASLAPAGEEPLPVGGLVVASDHLNLSGGSPLLGLGETHLGPLFPDLSRLHDAPLREAALAEGRRRGIALSAGVAACTPFPARETPAERRYFARAGARVAVQGLADPLVAAAHAGLVAVALVCIAESGEGQADLPAILAAAERSAPLLEDLVDALQPALAGTVASRRAEVPG